MNTEQEVSIIFNDGRITAADYIVIVSGCLVCFIMGLLTMVHALTISRLILIIVVVFVPSAVTITLIKHRITMRVGPCIIFQLYLSVNKLFYKRIDLLVDHFVSDTSIDGNDTDFHHMSLIVYNSGGLTKMYKKGDSVYDTFVSTLGNRMSRLMYPKKPIGKIILVSKNPVYEMGLMVSKRTDVYINKFLMHMDVITVPVDVYSDDPRLMINGRELCKLATIRDGAIIEGIGLGGLKQFMENEMKERDKRVEKGELI